MVFEKLCGDITVLKALMDGYKTAIGEPCLTEKQYTALQNAVNAGHIHFFLARNKNCAVAMCSVSVTFSTFSCQFSGVFEDFYIIPEHRKKGLARELTAYVLDWCRQNQIRSLWVGSADCDVELYRKLGFDLALGNLLAWTSD